MSSQRSLKRKNQIKNEFSTYHDFNEHCDFCILSFQTKPELKAHVLTHFKKKICLQTQKTLLFIAGDWFELHINHGCTLEQCDSEIITESVPVSERLVKKEENLEENILDNGGAYDDETNSVHIKSESDVELNFDACSSGSSQASIENKVRRFESRAKRTKSKTSKDAGITSAPNKRKKVPSLTKKKPTILNGNSLPTKPVLPKSKRTKCKICQQNFAQDELIIHLQSRHVPKIDSIPTCETCGKTFSTPGNLRSHQFLHAERGRYICNYCGKIFVRNANLKEHINLHTGARPFVCEVCNKTFHRETLLRNHRRIHTGEKKYRCNIEDCERAYMFDIDLKRHKFSAHGVYSKKHPCFICSKVFSENKLLKKHLEAH